MQNVPISPQKPNPAANLPSLSSSGQENSPIIGTGRIYRGTLPRPVLIDSNVNEENNKLATTTGKTNKTLGSSDEKSKSVDSINEKNKLVTSNEEKSESPSSTDNKSKSHKFNNESDVSSSNANTENSENTLPAIILKEPAEGATKKTDPKLATFDAGFFKVGLYCSY